MLLSHLQLAARMLYSVQWHGTVRLYEHHMSGCRTSDWGTPEVLQPPCHHEDDGSVEQSFGSVHARKGLCLYRLLTESNKELFNTHNNL